MNNKLRKFSCLWVGVVVVAFVGCGGIRTTTVNGKVTYQGKPAGNCSITLVASNGVTFSEVTGADGGFTIPEVPVGTVKVALVSLSGSGQNNKVRGGRDAAPGASSKPTPSGGEAPPPTPASTIMIDPKYADPETSKLTAEVQEGQPLTIDVK